MEGCCLKKTQKMILCEYDYDCVRMVMVSFENIVKKDN